MQQMWTNSQTVGFVSCLLVAAGVAAACGGGAPASSEDSSAIDAGSGDAAIPSDSPAPDGDRTPEDASATDVASEPSPAHDAAAPGDATLDGAAADGADSDAQTTDLRVQILAPVVNESWVFGEPVELSGTATGGSPPYAFAWRSHVDGVIGTSPSLSTSALSIGDHQITLEVTDAQDAMGTSAPVAVSILPLQFDWSHKIFPSAEPAAGDWMTPVKNQTSTCGGCWAFAAIGAMEAQWNIQQADPTVDIDLSEQYLIDCFTWSLGCSGGGAEQALNDFVRVSGVPEEACDPFLAHDSVCPAECEDGTSFALWRITGTSSIVLAPPDHVRVQRWMRNMLVHHGPVVRAMVGMEVWSSTTFGCAGGSGDHYVVVVGYDHTTQRWAVRNSWGSSWNGNGYFEIAYGQCAIDTSATVIEEVLAP